jgi:NAD-dependent SIR2 family protein deacetylase
MSFMELQIYRKGALYSADCSKCGATNYTHEWITDDHNGRRDAMEQGAAVCTECGGSTDPKTFHACGRQYAGRFSAPGYLDCTEWLFDANKRSLERTLREIYGDNDE